MRAPIPIFREAVLAQVARIPKGHVATYGQIAMMVGFPKRARQVGQVLKGLPPGSPLPWQRVVNAKGYVPSRGRMAEAEVQIQRLRQEGVTVDGLGNLDLGCFQWDGRPPAFSGNARSGHRSEGG